MAHQTLSRAALLERVAALPEQPGVYLFRDQEGRIIYVGKATNLRKRVKFYFRRPIQTGRGRSQVRRRTKEASPHQAGRTARESSRVAQLVHRIAALDIQTTSSEAEALLLESKLIKNYQPKYNVSFRDDKSFPLLKVTHERFPRLILTRERTRDHARYFGPYTDAGRLHEALRFLRRVFPMRTCRTFPKTPCLEYHIGQCLAPCVGALDEPAYLRIVEDLVAFLEGKREGLLRELTARMTRASHDQRYEEAGRLRNQIQALTSVIVAKEKSSAAGPLEQLQLALHLPVLPQRIEAFDISNIAGTFAVGSMVTFVDSQPHKAHYRHFKIETVHGIDDCQMMREVIRRRYGGSLTTTLPWPDLILVDGGKGQLGAALQALKALGRQTPVIGLAKQFEHLFVPGTRDPIVLLPTSPVLHLVQHVRDEAHRFAVTFHRRLRGKGATRSALDDIPGIGPKRKAALWSHFGSPQRLCQAGTDEIARVAKVSLQQAAALRTRLRGIWNRAHREPSN